MVDTQFTEFLKRKQLQEKSSSQIDWKRRRDVWLDQVQSLIQQVCLWLQPYQEQGLLDIKHFRHAIYEEVMGEYGRYEAPGIAISMGLETVSLMPVGMVVLGGLGRVDMDGPLGQIKMVLSDSDRAPAFRVVRVWTSMPVEAPTQNSAENRLSSIHDRMASAKWYFVPPDSQQTMLLVNADTFTETLRSLVRP